MGDLHGQTRPVLKTAVWPGCRYIFVFVSIKIRKVPLQIPKSKSGKALLQLIICLNDAMICLRYVEMIVSITTTF